MAVFFALFFSLYCSTAWCSAQADATIWRDSTKYNAAANTTIIIIHSSADQALVREFALFKDTTRRRTIAEILPLNDHFTPSDLSNSAQLPPTSSAIWLRFSVRNISGRACYFLLEDTGIDTLQTFALRYTDTAITHRTAGLTFASHRVSNLPYRAIEISPLDSTSGEFYVYVRIVSREPIGLIGTVGTAEALITRTHQQDTFNTFCIGMMSALVLYNLFLSIFLRSRLYAVYVGYGSTAILYTLYSTGLIVPLTGEYFTEHFVQGFAVPIAVFVLLYSLLFAILFLEIRTKIRVLWIPSLILLGAVVSIAFLWGLGVHELMFTILTWMTLPVAMLCSGAAILSGLRGNRGAWIYLAAWSALLIVFVVVGLSFSGVFSLTPIMFVLPQIGFSSELLLMSFALAYRIRTLQQERQTALLENERIVREQNVMLERSVQERTAELEEKNTHLVEANDEIQRQLVMLDEQAKNIELSNSELREASENLSLVNHEIMETQVQLELANAELEHRNQTLVDTEQFRLNMLSIVSHDLKGPISGILGLSAVLLDNTVLEAETRVIVEHLQESAVRMNRLVADILDTAAREIGKIELFRQPTELCDIVSTAIAHYSQAATHKNQQFLIEQSGEYWTLGDTHRLVQVFDNLISNAVKYSPIGGRIWVRCSQTDAVVRVSVQDEGVGLSKEDQAKLFGFFQRLSTKTTGGESSSGVGLSIVKQLVELHGGKVWCESELGNGATFIVELPTTTFE